MLYKISQIAKILHNQERLQTGNLAKLTVLSNGKKTGTYSVVGNMSDCRYVSGCRFRGHKFDPGPVPYFRGD